MKLASRLDKINKTKPTKPPPFPHKSRPSHKKREENLACDNIDVYVYIYVYIYIHICTCSLGKDGIKVAHAFAMP